MEEYEDWIQELEDRTTYAFVTKIQQASEKIPSWFFYLCNQGHVEP